jgi:hypothetical protein
VRATDEEAWEGPTDPAVQGEVTEDIPALGPFVVEPARPSTPEMWFDLGGPPSQGPVRVWGAAPGLAAGAAFALAMIYGVVVMFTPLDRRLQTPERALDAVHRAFTEGDLAAAEGFFVDGLWARADGGRAMEDARSAVVGAATHEGVRWTSYGHRAAAVTWEAAGELPALASDAGVWWEKRRGRWTVARYASAGTAGTADALGCLVAMRDAVQARDADAFFAWVDPAGSLCKGEACGALRRAVRDGERHAILDALAFRDVEAGSARWRSDADETVLRWLRPTAPYGLGGMQALTFRMGGEGVRLAGFDGTHADALEDELQRWAREHPSLLWQAKLSEHVRIRQIPMRCAREFFGYCLVQGAPIEARNVGDRTIRGLRVTAPNRQGGRGMPSSFWFQWGEIAPGRVGGDPSSNVPEVLPASVVRGGGELEGASIAWIAFDGGERWEPPQTRDELTADFVTVRALRVAAGRSEERFERLMEERRDAGFEDLAAPPARVLPEE